MSDLGNSTSEISGTELTSGQDLAETGIITTYLLVIGKTFYWIGIISLTFFLFKFATRFLFPGLTGGLHFDGNPPKYGSNQLNRNLTTRNGGVVGMDTNAATQLTAKALPLSSAVSARFFFELSFILVQVLFLAFWIFVIFLVYQMVVWYLIPAIFGPPITYVPTGSYFDPNYPYMRMGTGGIVGMDENAATQLTAKVTRAVAGPVRVH
ncbi:unnamed protein product [Allacma fusca]|uniref:Uncharacterized protein n=1 Tax=Allacma fusca TaxID=39272 RepID=A0A8J2K615_9HEXA|nr:unnamed protein product [Allacma fusca]